MTTRGNPSPKANELKDFPDTENLSKLNEIQTNLKITLPREEPGDEPKLLKLCKDVFGEENLSIEKERSFDVAYNISSTSSMKYYFTRFLIDPGFSIRYLKALKSSDFKNVVQKDLALLLLEIICNKNKVATETDLKTLLIIFIKTNNLDVFNQKVTFFGGTLSSVLNKHHPNIFHECHAEIATEKADQIARSKAQIEADKAKEAEEKFQNQEKAKKEALKKRKQIEAQKAQDELEARQKAEKDAETKKNEGQRLAKSQKVSGSPSKQKLLVGSRSKDKLSAVPRLPKLRNPKSAPLIPNRTFGAFKVSSGPLPYLNYVSPEQWRAETAKIYSEASQSDKNVPPCARP